MSTNIAMFRFLFMKYVDFRNKFEIILIKQFTFKIYYDIMFKNICS